MDSDCELALNDPKVIVMRNRLKSPKRKRWMIVVAISVITVITAAFLGQRGIRSPGEDEDFVDPQALSLPEAPPEGSLCFLDPSMDKKHNTNPTVCGTDGGVFRLEDLLFQDSCNAPATYSDLFASSGTENLVDLLLSRGDGIFISDWEAPDTKTMLQQTFICHKHLQELGYKWYENHISMLTFRHRVKGKRIRQKKCAINEIAGFEQFSPIHDDPIPAVGFLTRDRSEALLYKHKMLAPVGLPLCKRHREDIDAMVKELQEQKKKEKTEKDVDTKGHLLRKTASLRQKISYGPKHCSQDLCSSQHSASSQTSATEGGEEGQGLSYSQEIQQTIGTTCKRTQRLPGYIAEIIQVRKIIRELAIATGVKELHFTPLSMQWDELKPGTVQKKVRAVRNLYKKIYEAVVPQCPADFEQMVLKHYSTRFWLEELPPVLDDIMAQVRDGYSAAETYNEKKAILSLVAPTLSFAQLQWHIPGVTSNMFKAARMWSKLYGPGASKPPKTKLDKNIIRQWKPEQLQSFICWLCGPLNVVDLPHGTLSLKTSKGRITIPKTVRAMRASRSVDQYLLYLKQTNQQHLKLSRSSLLKIIKVCTARHSKALAGLDYFTTDASKGFDQLISVATLLGKKNNIPEWEKSKVTALKEGKQYMQTTYRMHLKPNSKIADHCYSFALSDDDDPAFQAECEDHEHSDSDLLCDSCERLKNTMAEVRTVLSETEFEKETEHNYQTWITDESINSILKYKAHLVRGAWLDRAKQFVLDRMPEDVVFCVIDWAMKWLPRMAREGQSSWFGKRGISWHIMVCHIKEGDRFSKRTYVHIMQQANQVSSEVTAIITHGLEQIKKEKPNIKAAIIRSDNAMHYKAAATIASIPELSKGPILVKRWLFSEPQTGKGAADRAAARIKRHVEMYIDEKNDAANAEEFITAASSYNGLRDVSLFSGTVYNPADDATSRSTAGDKRGHGPTTTRKTKVNIPGISKFFDFHFKWVKKGVDQNAWDGELKVWRMPGIGQGKVIEQKYWKGKGNKHRFIVKTAKHENQDQWDQGYEYWKPIGETDYPTDPAMLQKANEETDAGVEEDDEIDFPGMSPDVAVDTSSVSLDDDDDITDDTVTTTYEQENENVLFSCPEPGCTRNYQFHGALAYSHNGSSYDTYMGLRYLLDNNIANPQVICNASRLLQLIAGKKVKLKDSFLMFGGSLRSLPTTFGFKSVASKGFFPHKLDAFKYLDYVGPPIDEKYYFTENMSETEYKDFRTHLSEQTKFNFRALSEGYCMEDTIVLALALQYFQRQCLQETNVAPLHHAMTLAQYCSLVFRSQIIFEAFRSEVWKNAEGQCCWCEEHVVGGSVLLEVQKMDGAHFVPGCIEDAKG